MHVSETDPLLNRTTRSPEVGTERKEPWMVAAVDVESSQLTFIAVARISTLLRTQEM